MEHSRRSSDAQATCVKESCSIQSHLSTTNSQQRLRIALAGSPVVSVKVDKAPEEAQVVPEMSLTSMLLVLVGLRTTPTLPSSTHDRHTPSRVWSTLLVKWIVLVYCLLSCIVLTIDCYKYLCISLANGDMLGQASDINNLSLQHRLSRLTSSKNVMDLEPYLLGHPSVDENDITACLWVEGFEDLSFLTAWSVAWPGSLSVLLSTTTPMASTFHSGFLGKMHDLKEQFGDRRLSLHLLYVKTYNSSKPSMYLNLARLFAPTTRVILFPAPVTYTPPAEFYGLAYTPLPALITTPLRKAYPFSELSPILLPRNHNMWCTERYVAAAGPVADWQECVWKMWIASLGKANIIPVQQLPGEHSEVAHQRDNVNLRLYSIFRTEYCDITIRNLSTQSKDAKNSLNWLKHFCAETVDKKM